MLKLSTLFVKTLREDPIDAEVPSHKLLVRAGYIRRVAPGIYTWLPLGLKVLGKVEQVIREEMDAVGGQEVHFPALLPKEPYEATGRWSEYGPNMFRLKDRRENDYLLAPTHEEMFTLLVKDLYSSYKELPVTLYQIQTKYRDEARPRAGLLRGREFIMKDAYTFDMDDEGLNASYDKQRGAYIRIFTRLGLDFAICSAMSGPMGGSHSEEFLFPTEVGEDTFVRSPGGYTANVEAVTTPFPPTQPIDGQPAAHVEPTPDVPTIASLVDLANATQPRPDRPWKAEDTLKNVVVAVTPPGGKRELLVIGLPGNREVDMGRLEAALSPNEVEMAVEADFAGHPELVRGYIGPQVLGEDGTRVGIANPVRYVLDPRVVAGTRWITGANIVDSHVFDIVAGRDFVAASPEAGNTIEAAEVLPGDEAPDGSGPLEMARGIEIGHIFALGLKYSKALGLHVLDVNGKQVTVTMGSYGIGVSRAVAAIAEGHHDDQGLCWPVNVAPAHVHIVATGKDEAVFRAADQLAGELESRGIEVLYDDRPKVSPGVKFADAELLGVPFVAVVGKGLAEGVIEIRDRRTGERQNVPVSTADDVLEAKVREALKATR